MPRYTPRSNCDLDDIANARPCLNCLSNKELLAALIYILAEANDQTVAEALTSADCLKCLSEKQKLVGLVNVLADTFLESFDISDMYDQLKCLECASDSVLTATLIAQICEYFNAPN